MPYRETMTTYSIYQQHENDSATLLASGLSKVVAVVSAAELLSQGKSHFTVEFFRKSDGQHGYLNQDGNHAPTGKHWV
jgi:hypothetical protein